MLKLAFLAHDEDDPVRRALAELYGESDVEAADVLVCLGGDGFMLQTLHKYEDLSTPVYGMNRGTVGFLMNEFSEDNLRARIEAAETATIHPLRMHALTVDGEEIEALAINEVSLLRHGPQAAKLKLFIDGRERLSELVCDGALVSTPAGSTAYNYSAHGPIVPIGAEILAITAMAAYRPRRWRGALVPASARVRFEVLEANKRPVAAAADGFEALSILSVEIASEPNISHHLLFDPGHGLEERLIREQFI